MPRLELTSPNWDNSPESRRGDGAPTIDVCRSCATDFLVGDVIEAGEPLYLRFANHTITCTEVEHPGLEEYKCEVCNAQLTDEDN